MSRGPSRHESRGDRGLTVVLFAVSITAMLAVASLVLGGSTGYGASRNMQTAADAASLAATSQLREAKVAEVDPAVEPDYGTVGQTALSVAIDNGADAGTVGCEVVRAAYAVSASELEVLGPCDGTTETDPAASGIRVTVRETRGVPFGEFVGRNTITASARAAATVQPVRGGVRTPFMLCADARNTAGANPHGVEPLLPHASANSVADPPWRINPDAVGVEFLLWANGNAFGDRNCGESQFHGFVDPGTAFQVPSHPDRPDEWWKIDPGSGVGHLPSRLAAAVQSAGGDCDLTAADEMVDLVGCALPVPLCVDMSGSGQNARMKCVRVATFRITYSGTGRGAGSCVSVNGNGHEVLCGVLLPSGVATGGQGSLEPADPSELVVVKLVE